MFGKRNIPFAHKNGKKASANSETQQAVAAMHGPNNQAGPIRYLGPFWFVPVNLLPK